MRHRGPDQRAHRRHRISTFHRYNPITRYQWSRLSSCFQIRICATMRPMKYLTLFCLISFLSASCIDGSGPATSDTSAPQIDTAVTPDSTCGKQPPSDHRGLESGFAADRYCCTICVTPKFELLRRVGVRRSLRTIPFFSSCRARAPSSRSDTAGLPLRSGAKRASS